MSTRTDAICSAAMILRAQAMPAEEIRAVIGAADAQTVHMYLELHRERLQERLAEQFRLLIDLERSLTERSDATSGCRRGGEGNTRVGQYPGVDLSTSGLAVRLTATDLE